MGITIRRELYVKAQDKNMCEWRSQKYVNGEGLKRVEIRSLEGESDWSSGLFERYSDDNGRTWSQWKDIYSQGYEKKGEDEISTNYGCETYNPQYKHFVSLMMNRIFLGGHTQAYKRFWEKGEAGFIDHCFLSVRNDKSQNSSVKLIKYEEGADYDPDNWLNPEYITRNRAYFGCNIDILNNGEIIFPIGANVKACCRILSLNINDIFPSCPDIMCGMIVVRGIFNQSSGNYDFIFSKPVVISDLKSSRGIDEPAAISLPSGRIIAVFRGSNVECKDWNTRIEPGTPSHKWYCWSDDGGKTFTDPVPWHFDNREVFYSPASISNFIKSISNGKIYWIGNITGYNAYGGHPRYPLVIAEVNERGLLKKETLTIIDTRQEGESKEVQLSNFSILQDRETGLIELYLTKIGQHEGYTWWADCYRYFIDVNK
ncbi:MAG TPA: sialidase family protein [bacterium]|nr:sialidase family protein [bacterium]